MPYCLAGGGISYSQAKVQWIFGAENALAFHSAKSKNYYISIGVFQNQNNAYQLLKNLKKYHIKSAHLSLKKGRYHIFIGPIASSEDVRSIGKLLINRVRVIKSKDSMQQAAAIKPSINNEFRIQTAQKKRGPPTKID